LIWTTENIVWKDFDLSENILTTILESNANDKQRIYDYVFFPIIIKMILNIDSMH
jgi:hypothetical protein